MNDKMVEGFLDGSKPDNPEPSGNRSRSYRHGFQSGRDDLARRCSTSAVEWPWKPMRSTGRMGCLILKRAHRRGSNEPQSPFPCHRNTTKLLRK